MSLRRLLLNLVTIAFVIGTVYIALHSNLPNYFKGYLNKNNISLKNLISIPSEISDGIASIQKSFTSADEIVLPGPLSKIDTGQQKQAPTPTTPGGTLTVEGIIANTNTQRKNALIPVLQESTRLDASAKKKAEDILARQYFEHTSPDGKTVSDLVTAEGYDFIRVGENLALGNFKDDADVVLAWMNSPGHRANILDARYTDIGVGVAFGMYQGHYVGVAVQHFGRPRSTCPSVDSALKKQVLAGQSELDAMATSLEAERTTIEEGTSQDKDMSSQIEHYNSEVDTYQAEYQKIDDLRTKYNTQVAAFNDCILSDQ